MKQLLSQTVAAIVTVSLLNAQIVPQDWKAQAALIDLSKDARLRLQSLSVAMIGC